MLVYSLEHISQSYKVSGVQTSVLYLTKIDCQEYVFPFVTPYVLALIHMSLTGSVYTTIALAVERCITVLAPFTKIKVSDGSGQYAFSAQFLVSVPCHCVDKLWT